MKPLWGTVLFALVFSNLFWWVQHGRQAAQLSYHATHLCEVDRLLSLQNLLQKSDLQKLKRLCKSGQLQCQKEKNSYLVDYNISRCPDSGRPYCGFEVSLQDNTVSSIASRYPCH